METAEPELDIEECYRVVIDVTKKAGQMIKDAWLKEKSVQIKSSQADLVTASDQEVERLIIFTLHESFPSHCFIGEESVAAGAKCELTDCPTWVIDPIDGTTNFVHRFPCSAVSIALVVKKQIEIGVVYNPIQNELYKSCRGQGAYCNDKKLQVSKAEDLEKSLVYTGYTTNRDPAILDCMFRNMRSIIDNTHGIRTIGSAALGLAYVAAGRVDAFYQAGIHAWDYAAGALLIEEAGGVVMDPSGGPLDLLARRVLGSGTLQLAQQITSTIEPLDMGRD